MKDLIKQKILDFSIDAYKPIFLRDLSLGSPQSPKVGGLVNVVVGMRRSGKTYRLFQEIEMLIEQGVSSHNILYFNFEDDRLKPFSANLGDQVLAAFYELQPQAKSEGAYLFLDEIQEIPDWGTWLRRIVDTEKVTLYVTGSSAKVLSADIASEFRGRSLTNELLPFGFKEYLRYHDETLLHKSRPTTAENIMIKKHFEEYLLRGGFPAVQEEEKERLVAILQNYAQQVVAKDVIERHNLSNPQAISLFAKKALSYNGREISLRKTENQFKSQGTKVSRIALAAALSYFEDAFLLATVRPWTRALAEDPKVAAKVYAIDPGLAQANASAASEDKGQLLEDAIYLELRRRHPHRRDNLISSYKTKNFFEIDFIVGDALMEEERLFQVCVGLENEETFTREIRALQAAMEERNTSHATLITLETQRKEITLEEGMIQVIPAWQWCLLP